MVRKLTDQTELTEVERAVLHPSHSKVGHGWKRGAVTAVERLDMAYRIKRGDLIDDIAHDMNRNPNFIMRIAAQVTPETAGTLGNFGKGARIKAIDDMVALLRQSWEEHPPTPLAIRNWSITLGVLIDKRRLEEGVATSNTEVHVKVWNRRSKPGEQ